MKHINLSQKNQIYSFLKKAQNEILNRKPRQLSTLWSASHVAFLKQSSIQETDKAQQSFSASFHEWVNRIVPDTVEYSNLSIISVSLIISRIPSIEISQAVPSHTAILNILYCTFDHCSHISTVSHYALRVTQSFFMTYQMLTDWTSISHLFAVSNASYCLFIDSVSQSSHVTTILS